MNFNETIKSWRWRIVKADFTIQDFAESIGMSSAQISNYFAGRVRPSLDTFEKIEGKLQELGV